MQDLGFYFDLGWHHIISVNALDHLLFVLALSAVYLPVNWRQVLVLITAFTIGHSLTLILSVYDVIRADDKWVEFLIPCTIAVTALFNFFQKGFTPRSLGLNYIWALFFGLIHGLGFANAIRFMLIKEQGPGWPLFGFNTGLEAGQIAVVFCILLLSYLAVEKAKLNRRWWVWILSSSALAVSIKMAIEQWPL